MVGNSLWNGMADFSQEQNAVTIDSFDELPEFPQGKVLLTVPYLPYKDRELAKVQEFVTLGGKVLLMDDYGHGTHCSGTIAAEGNNGLDITGICWNAKIMGLKFLDNFGDGTVAGAVKAFYYAVENGADITSNSWGVPGVKAAMNLTGFKGGQPRHPLKPVSDEVVEEIRRRITSEGLMKA